jgi:hypothetical protein
MLQLFVFLYLCFLKSATSVFARMDYVFCLFSTLKQKYLETKI